VGSFGDKFRKERERQGIKLEDVSNSTKISSRMLRAIEDEHFDQLPGGVFNRGFIRAYAKNLGLDEEEAVAGYMAAMNQPGGPPLAAEKSAAQSGTKQAGAKQQGPIERRAGPPGRRQIGDRRSSANPQADELPDLQLPKAEHVRSRRKMSVYSDSSGIGWRIPTLVALVIIAGAIWWTRSRNAHADGASPLSAPAAPASEPLTTVSSGSAQLVGNDARTSSTSHPAKAAPSPSATSVSSANPAGARAETGSPQQEAQDSEPAASTAEAPVPRPRANLTLVIRAQENSWIAVTADGQPAIHETLIAPAHASVRAAREIVVRAGNAAGVTFSLNGQEFPAQGAEGEVKTLVFDLSGMRQAPPSGAIP